MVGDQRKKFTLKLVGNNTIKNSGSGYGLTVTSEDQSSLDSPGNYMTFTVTGDSGASLKVNGIDIVKGIAKSRAPVSRSNRCPLALINSLDEVKCRFCA